MRAALLLAVALTSAALGGAQVVARPPEDRYDWGRKRPVDNNFRSSTHQPTKRRAAKKIKKASQKRNRK